jgi:ribosomal protein S18 acetylase RimI-like enzyme/uncharacterized damage-inducible protein DinB
MGGIMFSITKDVDKFFVNEVIVIAEDLPEYFNENGIKKLKEDVILQDLFVIKELEEIVGFAIILSKSKEVSEISWLAVRKEKQGNGYGTYLVNTICEELARKGQKVLEVKTLSEIIDYAPYQKTREFYKKLDFILLETIDPYDDWGPGNPCAIYIKLLNKRTDQEGKFKMNYSKEEIIHQNLEMINWVNSLNTLSKELWRTPIGEGKWTIAEIIAHLTAWDQFILESRLLMNSEEEFPAAPKVEEFNSKAAEYGRTHSKEIVINDFIECRKRFIEILQKIDSPNLEKPFYKNYTLLQYIGGFIEHDLHHKEQIIGARIREKG